MHAWKHWLMGAGFFGFAAFTFLTDGLSWLVGLCVIAAGYLFYRAIVDQTGAAAEDLQLAVAFVRDPRETLVDIAVGRFAGDEEQETPRRKDPPGVFESLVAEFAGDEPKRKEPAAFDPDAAIARYLANRPSDQPASVAPAPRPAYQGFGRKRA